MCTRSWSSDYLDLLLLFSIPTLGDRRLYLSLCTMYKIVHKLVDFPQDVFIPKSTRLRSSSLTLTFVQPFARTNSLKFSFIPHTCSIWNTLPNYITGAESLMAFKSFFKTTFVILISFHCIHTSSRYRVYLIISSIAICISHASCIKFYKKIVQGIMSGSVHSSYQL